MKRCKKCGATKPLADFYLEKGGRDGHRPECKACNLAMRKARYRLNPAREIARVQVWQQKNREHVRAYRRKRYQERKLDMRAGHLRRKFGMTLADYDEILRQQGGCAICGDRPEEGQSFHIDHDPASGVVRGILCVRCNNALGQLKESPELVLRAADYLDVIGFVPGGLYELRDAAIARARSLSAARR